MLSKKFIASSAAILGLVFSTLSVLPAKAVTDVTVDADDKTSSYGTTPPALTLTPSNESFSYDSAPTCAIYAPADTEFTTALTLDESTDAGTYTIHCEGGTYDLESWNVTALTDGTLTINAANGVVVTPAGDTYTYGATAPALGYTTTGFFGEDDFSVEPTCLAHPTTDTTYVLGFTPDESTEAGTYNVHCTGGDAGNNYSTTTFGSDGTLIVNAEAGIVVTPGTGFNYTYGGTAPLLTYTDSGWVGEDDWMTEPVCLAYGTADATYSSGIEPDGSTDAGTYNVHCTGGDAGSNYGVTEYDEDGTLVIDPAAGIEVTTGTGYSYTYGETAAVLGYTDSGWVGEDDWVTEPVCLAYFADDTAYEAGFIPTSTTAVGTYVVHCTGGDAGSNYEDTSYTADGSLTISAADGIVVTPVSDSYNYGSSAPALTYTATGWVGEDDWAIEPVCLAYNSEDTLFEEGFIPTSTTAVGTYVVHCTGGDAGSNYDPTSYGADGTLEVTKGTSTLDYTGVYYLGASSSSATLQANLGGACAANSVVKFYYDSDGDGIYETLLNEAIANESGVATYSWAVPAGVTMFDVEAVYDESESCTGAVATATLVIGSSGDSSNGGGWYNLYGKVGLGYTVQSKTSKGVTTSTGQLLWTSKSNARFKGTINSYTKSACPTGFTGTCAVISGTGKLSIWNSETLAWDVTGSTVAFSLKVLDGGTAQVCTGPKRNQVCSTVAKPDYFAMSISTFAVTGETTVLTQMKGGNLVVK